MTDITVSVPEDIPEGEKRRSIENEVKLRLSSERVIEFATRVDTSIERGLVAIWPSALVTFAVNSLVPLAVGVPEIVEPTSEIPAGSVPALIDHEYVPSAPAALSCWLYSLPLHAVGSILAPVRGG